MRDREPLALGRGRGGDHDLDIAAGVELPPRRKTAEGEVDYICTSEPFRLRLPGTYAVEIAVEDEILASGTWEVVEAGE